MKQDKSEKQVKIIHVVQHLAPGGIETMALDLIRFAPTSCQVLVLSLEGEKQQAIEKWPKLKDFSDKILFLEKKSGVQPSIVMTLAKIFSIVKPDTVHTHHIGPLLYAGIASLMSGVPCRIHTEHDIWHLSNKKHVKLQKLALKAVKPILVGDADYVSKALKSQFNYHNTITIKNGIDCEKFRPGCQHRARNELGLPQSHILIGCAGRLEKVKGHDVMIKALARLPSHISLVVAGSGSELAKLRSLSQKLNVESRVIFLGLIEDMPTFYQSLDIFCLPSRMEGFPLSALEAQACDIRTVVTDVGASRETLCPKTGKLVEVNDSSQLAEVLFKMLSTPLEHLPREFVIGQHDVRHMVEAYQTVMTEAIAC